MLVEGPRKLMTVPTSPTRLTVLILPTHARHAPGIVGHLCAHLLAQSEPTGDYFTKLGNQWIFQPEYESEARKSADPGAQTDKDWNIARGGMWIDLNLGSDPNTAAAKTYFDLKRQEIECFTSDKIKKVKTIDTRTGNVVEIFDGLDEDGFQSESIV